MIDGPDLELGEDPFEKVDLQNRAEILPIDQIAVLPRQGLQIDGDDRRVLVGREVLDEAVADLAARTGDEDDWFAHGSLRGVQLKRILQVALL